jgi:hypothetical protein
MGSPAGVLRFVGVAIAVLSSVGEGCANKGAASGTTPDGATKTTQGADGGNDAMGTDGPVAPTSNGTCPAATVLCNGYCLAAGQSSGGCTALVTGLDSEALAVAAGYVYYPVSGAVWRVPTGGGAPAKFVDAAQYTSAMAVDSTNLYLTGSASDGSTIVGYAPLAGGSFKKLQGKDNGSTQIGGIAVDSSHVYWTEMPDLDGTQPAIFRIAIAGGSTVEIGNGTAPDAIAVDSQYLYWSDNAVIWKTALATAGTIPLGDAGANAGGAVEVYSAFSGYGAVSLAPASGYLYWGDDNELMGLGTNSDGGAVQTLASDGAESLVLDGTDIYLTTTGGQVVRYQTTSATSQVLAAIPAELPNLVSCTLVVDAANVYVLIAPLGEGGLHGIVRISK